MGLRWPSWASRTAERQHRSGRGCDWAWPGVRARGAKRRRKTRMLDKCPESAEALGMSVLRARCGELTRDYPFGISRDLFESALIPADAGDARRE
jgi:hypothetical protein